MTILQIKDFSCIHFAAIDIAACTIFIGEQASGKSVVSKLMYFFGDIIFKKVFEENEIIDIHSFRELIEQDFLLWFPTSAWGEKKFQITYQAGEIFISLERKITRRKVASLLDIQLSSSLIAFFHEYKEAVAKAESEINKTPNLDDNPFRRFSLLSSIESQYRDVLRADAEKDYISWQLFIPAGRSFFTSFGKAITAFERSRMLDPITMRFGEFYLNAKQRKTSKAIVFPRVKIDQELSEIMQVFFGGNLVNKKDEEYISTRDGRMIPVAYLSSGQQELLPLWQSIEEIVNYRSGDYVIYIEEPEAHIFPSTQSSIVEYLSAYLVNKNKNSRVVLTTHSPYVLAKFNNLLKAGIVGRKRGKSQRVAEIVGRDSWLPAGSVAAYTIVNGVAKSIMGDDYLIDAEYLDSVSGVISEEYMKLVEVEIG